MLFKFVQAQKFCRQFIEFPKIYSSLIYPYNGMSDTLKLNKRLYTCNKAIYNSIDNWQGDKSFYSGF
jgi:hypothetical protein